MGGGGHEMPKIPDYTRYKWQDFPQLVQHQERLAAHGLHDPWARNHVWKFMIPATKNKLIPWYKFWGINYPTQRGILYGLFAIGVYIGIDKMTGGSNDGHDHH